MDSLCSFTANPPFKEHLHNLKSKFPNKKKKINKFFKDINKSIHSNCEISPQYKPSSVNINSFKSEIKNR